MNERFSLGEQEVTIRPFLRADFPMVARFAADLPPHDLLFLSRDIQHARVIDAWMRACDTGDIESLLAVTDDDEVVATTAVVRDRAGWSAHVAELRLLVAPKARGYGLGRRLLDASIAVAIEGGATKLTARMTPDQVGAVTLFEEAGFRGEALLRDQVRDRAGNPYDLAVLSLDPARFIARREGYSEERNTLGAN